MLGAGPGLARATVGGNANPTGKNAVAPTIAAPVPGYAQFCPGEIEGAMNVNDNVNGVNERIYSVPVAAGDLGNIDVGTMAEGRRTVPPVPGLGPGREGGAFSDQYQEDHRPQKRARTDEEGYTMLSSPQMPPTPFPAGPPLQSDSLTTLESLFMDLGEFVNEREFDAECKRWRECTTEEWVRGGEGT